MSFTSEAVSAIRRMFIIDEELTRLTSEVKSLTGSVHDLDLRLTVVETTLAIAANRSRLILPAN